MVVKARPGCMVLGQWSHRDGTPSRPLPVNAAMMLNGSVLYIGADLLCWDVLQEEPAKMLVANMVRFMLGIDF
ncbi:MAG TPA: hypothetical protein DCL63_12150, partial [Firmicutes bacterium]|nr:hypothetical protein [Bacillota bacterium]